MRSSTAAAFLEILSETLQTLDASSRAQFLRGFFRALTHLEISEEKSTQLWDEIVSRRDVLAAALGRSVSLHTALVDVFTSSDHFRFPILIERDDLKKLELSAVTDPLTGLSNRRLFQQTFEKELNRAKRYAHPLSLVTLDLHRFKEVNDRLGHPRGDEVLRAVAATLKKALRTSDAAFRIGGDEFALLLPQTDAAQALALSKRVSTTFSEVLRPLDIPILVSIDHGVATFPSDAANVDELIQIADARLYRLKHANHAAPSESAPTVETSASPPTPIPLPTTRDISGPAAPSEIARPKPAESSLAAAVSASALRVSTAGTAPSAEVQQPRPPYLVQRKAERVSMTGTNAYAVLGEGSSRRARVLDLGFGGVALEIETLQDLPESFLAVLHVPILPPVRVNLKPVWSRPSAEGNLRVGCCFIS